LKDIGSDVEYLAKQKEGLIKYTDTKQACDAQIRKALKPSWIYSDCKQACEKGIKTVNS
jgi:hypothetical protein